MELLRVVAGLWLAFFSQSAATLQPDPPIACASCEAWNKAVEPFKVFGNTYYVGVEGLSSVLITSGDGHILFDGALPQSAAMIDRNIRRLGLRPEDIRLIVNSHAHYDHAGGIAAFQRLSGVTVAASPSGARALEAGLPTPDDPQYIDREAFPPVSGVRVVSDGEVLRVGALEITARLTQGHTPGSTAWTWRSCEGTRCMNVVYADSLNAVSSQGFRFTGDATRPSIVESFRRSILTVENLSCDILLTVHPGFSNVFKNLERHRDRQTPSSIRKLAALTPPTRSRLWSVESLRSDKFVSSDAAN
jgi:metallo-beta-lactamase class B